jgi:hypothetical protein
VFLAHASEDKPFVRKLFKILKESGLDPWLDEENLMPGVKWDDKIVDAIEKSRFFIACISSHSITKDGYIQKELRVALSNLEKKSAEAIYFIPALIEDVDLPNITVGTIRLADYQAAKIYDPTGMQNLVTYLLGQANIVKEVKQSESLSFEEVRNVVANGQVETGLRLLLEIVKINYQDFYNNVVIISSRFSRLKNENILGLISQENYAMESNKIVYSILETIKLLEASKK